MSKQALKLDAPAMSFVVQGPDDFERVHEPPDRKPLQVDVVALILRAKNREVELTTWRGCKLGRKRGISRERLSQMSELFVVAKFR